MGRVSISTAFDDPVLTDFKRQVEDAINNFRGWADESQFITQGDVLTTRDVGTTSSNGMKISPTFNLGKTLTISTPQDIRDNASPSWENITLSGSASAVPNAYIWTPTGSSTNLVLEPDNDLYLNPQNKDVLPVDNYDINIGKIDKKYLTIYGAELRVETLVAQDTIATIGGRILVGATTNLTRDLNNSDVLIYVKHNEMTTGDRAYMESEGKVEFFSINSSGVLQGAGDYRYSVTRNLDGSGANEWYAGDAIFNTGQTGEGFIDMYSFSGIKGSTTGPTIVGNVRNSSTYNDWTEHWAIGNLNGLYGLGSVYGVAIGKYDVSNSYLIADDSNGIRIFNGGSVLGQWDTSGKITSGKTTQEHIEIDGTSIEFKNGATTLAELNGSTWTLGNTVIEHIQLDATSLKFFFGATELAELNATTWTLGNTSIEHLQLDPTSMKFLNGATTLAELNGSTWTLGNTALEHIQLDSTSMKFLNGASTLAELSGSIWTLGNTSLEHIQLDTTSIKFLNGVTNLAELNGTTWRIGEDSASKSAVRITSGTITLGTSTIDVFKVDSSGDGFFDGDITSTATITGGIIRTAATAPKVELNGTDNALNFYGDTGFTSGRTWSIQDQGTSSYTQLTFTEEFSSSEILHFYNDVGFNLRARFNSQLELQWGTDVNLYRSGTNQLKTDDAFVAGSFTTTGNISCVNVIVSGQVQFDAGTTSVDGLIWGTDTNLYRSAANTLKTDDAFIASSIDVSGSSEANQFLINGLTVINSSRAITGTSIDVSGNSDANAFRINGTTIVSSTRDATFNSLDIDGLASIDATGDGSFVDVTASSEIFSDTFRPNTASAVTSDFKSKSATASGINIKDNNDVLYGRIYGSNPSVPWIGFLDKDVNWAYKIIADDSHEWSINNTLEMTLDTAGLNVNAIYYNANTETSGTTIDVAGKSFLEISYALTTTVTNFTNGQEGQILYITKTGGASFTIQNDNSNIHLAGSSNLLLPSNSTLTLILSSDGWVEISRSIN